MKKKELINEKINSFERKLQSLLGDFSLLKNSINDTLSKVEVSKELGKPTPRAIKKVSSEEDTLPVGIFEQQKYEIKVVGLGIEKYKE